LVRGYKGEGNLTTFFDNLVLNDLDRFLLAIDVINRLSQMSDKAAKLKLMLEEKLIEQRTYINNHDEDLSEIRNWKWNKKKIKKKEVFNKHLKGCALELA